MKWKITWQESDGRNWTHRDSFLQHKLARMVRKMMRQKRGKLTVTKITLSPEATP